MRFGICTDAGHIGMAHELGFDYVEGSASWLAGLSEKEFSEYAAKLSEYPIWNYSFEGRKADGYASLLNAGLKAGEQVENLTLEGTSSAAFWPGRIKYRRFPKPARRSVPSLEPAGEPAGEESGILRRPAAWKNREEAFSKIRRKKSIVSGA